jgi:hypothetical protein
LELITTEETKKKNVCVIKAVAKCFDYISNDFYSFRFLVSG